VHDTAYSLDMFAQTRASECNILRSRVQALPKGVCVHAWREQTGHGRRHATLLKQQFSRPSCASVRMREREMARHELNEGCDQPTTIGEADGIGPRQGSAGSVCA